MEVLTEVIFTHLPYAHLIIFALLMLAGLNIPISEDFMLILSGMLASTVLSEHAGQLFFWVFLGSYLSDWESYWLGRWLGGRLFKIRWLNGRVSRRKLAQIGLFYKRYGIMTLVIGRFIPFGVRNCLFMSAGIGRMHFAKFILVDGIACLLSNTSLFLLAYSFGKNYLKLYEIVSMFNIVLFALFTLAMLGLGIYFWKRRRLEAARASA